MRSFTQKKGNCLYTVVYEEKTGEIVKTRYEFEDGTIYEFIIEECQEILSQCSRRKDHNDLMKGLGMVVGIPNEIYYCTLSERCYLFVENFEGRWEFYKTTFWRNGGGHTKVYISSQDFYSVYERVESFFYWLKTRRI